MAEPGTTVRIGYNLSIQMALVKQTLISETSGSSGLELGCEADERLPLEAKEVDDHAFLGQDSGGKGSLDVLFELG